MAKPEFDNTFRDKNPLTEEEIVLRRRAAVFTIYSFDVYAGKEGVYKTLDEQPALGVILTPEEIEAARELRTLIPEPPFEYSSYVGSRIAKGNYGLASYRGLRSHLRFWVTQYLKDRTNIADARFMELMDSDPSGKALVQRRLNDIEDEATQALLASKGPSEATLRYSTAEMFIENIVNPRAEFEDEYPDWLKEPKFGPENFEVIPISEDILHTVSPNMRETMLRWIIFEQTGYVEENGEVKLAAVLRAQGARLFYDVYTKRVDYYLGYLASAK